ncbi:MAG: hypothetical protein H6837_02155 [Planctomycetes bacterium]|nr:hypothetical protein [Planctomycetota bacterium]
MRCKLIHPVGFATASLFALTPSLHAQEYRDEKIVDVGIEITISKRLKRLPIRLDSSDPSLRAKFRPQDEKDYVQTAQGPYWWYTNVREWKTDTGPKTGPGKAAAEPGKGKDKGKTDPEADEKTKELLEKLNIKIREEAKSFEQWVKSEEPYRFLTKGRVVKPRGKFLGYKHWEYLTKAGTSLDWYNAAAVYTLGSREVALIISMPLAKGDKPVGKFATFLRRCITSARALAPEEAELADSARRDKHADTDEKKAALEIAKKNIQSLRGWDYFTTPSYIVLYSWEDVSKMGAYVFCKRLVTKLEAMRMLYQDYYPPRKGMKMPYSVFRICATYEQFQKYGDSPPGVVGWFSPRSKELVVFQGGDKLMRAKGATDTVTFHEGWHQYCDAYFGTELHRWFDEGHGDFFGAHVQRGNGWYYAGSHMRHKWVKLMVKKGDFVPFKDIVTWNKDKFYGQRAAYYYAQAYGMIDFLRRGRVMGKKFDPSWEQILPTYQKVALEKHDQSAAVKAAFAKVDYKAMEEAWKDWVNSPRFKAPK